jgi:hypothetical protein
VPRRIRLEHGLACDALLLVEVLEVGALLRGERLRVPGDGDHVRVLRDAPVPASQRPVVPPHRGLTAEERERLVGKAVGEDVVLEVDVLEAESGVEHGHRVEPSRICRVFRSE